MSRREAARSRCFTPVPAARACILVPYSNPTRALYSRPPPSCSPAPAPCVAPCVHPRSGDSSILSAIARPLRAVRRDVHLPLVARAAADAGEDADADDDCHGATVVDSDRPGIEGGARSKSARVDFREMGQGAREPRPGFDGFDSPGGAHLVRPARRRAWRYKHRALCHHWRGRCLHWRSRDGIHRLRGSE